MRCLAILFGILGLVAVAYPANDECYSNIDNLCKSTTEDVSQIKFSCNARYSGSHIALKGLQKYVLQHISHSYKYLLLATVFNSYTKNRPGFEKFYRKLSDDTWEDSIEIIKYITKRGHSMDFSVDSYPVYVKESDTLDTNELQSLSKVLDLHKNLAHQAHIIHENVTKHSDSYHDAEVSSFIEKTFVHKHADTIRHLSGHVNNLFNMSKSNNKEEVGLALYLFDEYLQKVA